MGKYIKANLDPSMTDKEIKETIRLMVNGWYTIKICKGCGMYWQSIDGDLETAEIVNECDYCSKDDC